MKSKRTKKSQKKTKDYFKRMADARDAFWEVFEQIDTLCEKTFSQEVAASYEAVVKAIGDIATDQVTNVKSDLEKLDPNETYDFGGLTNWTLQDSIDELDDIVAELEAIPRTVSTAEELAEALEQFESVDIPMQEFTVPV